MGKLTIAVSSWKVIMWDVLIEGCFILFESCSIAFESCSILFKISLLWDWSDASSNDPYLCAFIF